MVKKPTQCANQGDPITMTVCIVNNEPSLLQAYQNGYREPTNHTKAMSTEDAAKLREAEEAEIHSMLKNKLYEMVKQKSPQKKLIPCKWVYKHKRDSAGHVQIVKARLVAKGPYQIYG